MVEKKKIGIILMIVIIVGLSLIVGELYTETNELDRTLMQSAHTLTEYQSSINQTNITNQKYLTHIIKGQKEFYTAGINLGYANAYYDKARESYANEDYSWCRHYAGIADAYYVYASHDYRDAKAFFGNAEFYARSKTTQELTKKLVTLCEVDAQCSDELHEANEYFASACFYYSQNNYLMGGSEIDKMNEHIEKRDVFVPVENDLWSSIDVLLEVGI